MAALHGYAQFLQNLDHDERGTTAAEGLLVEVRSLSEMINAFLNFARPQPLQLEEVSLKELLDNCARELTPLFEERRVDLNTEFASQSDFRVSADARMLRQALLNLLRNAIEAISESQETRRVDVTIEDVHGNDFIQLSVQDSGPGIDPADLDKVFIPFFTTKTTGHGVGLPLAHRVITEHGGSLSVENSPEGGAVFTMRLPVATP
jgi:signal transduction histidine kinase